jgi:hypothetical protein
MEEDIIADTDTPPPTMENEAVLIDMDATNRPSVAILPRGSSSSQSNDEALTSKESTPAPQDQPSTSNNTLGTSKPVADSWSIQPQTVYKWRDWRLMRSTDSLFIWCDAVALELW